MVAMVERSEAVPEPMAERIQRAGGGDRARRSRPVGRTATGHGSVLGQWIESAPSVNRRRTARTAGEAAVEGR